MKKFKCLSAVDKHLYTETTGTILIIASFIVFVAALIIFICCGSWTYSTVLDEAKVGTFGDFIGGVVGTLLAFVASVLYYVALKEQRAELSQNKESVKLQTEALQQQIKEFEAQKIELELSREVYSKQCEIMLEEERTMHIQQFDSHFFGMLGMYRDIKRELDKNLQSDSFFDDILSSIDKSITRSGKDFICTTQIVVRCYVKKYIDNQNKLSPYFRCLYRIIRQIDDNPFLTDEDKWRYSKLVRAQFTQSELLVIYYNCLSNISGQALLLYYRYNLFKHIETVKKIEFLKTTQLCLNNIPNILFFGQWLSPIIETFINKVCDNNLDVDITEEFKNNQYNTIVKCMNDMDNVIFEFIILSPDVFKNYSNIKDIILCVLYDKLFYSRFAEVENMIKPVELINTETKEIHITYTFPGCDINRIKVDLY